MEITQSILNSIKKMIGGISADDEAFDADLIIHINSAFSILSQLGVGPAEGFEIKDSTAVWTEFVDDDATFKLVFDPPLSSAVLECYKEQIGEYEWRLNVAAEKRKKCNGGASK